MKNKFLLQTGDWPKPLVQQLLRAAKPDPDVFAGITPEQFIRHLLTSLSLNIQEKHRVIQSVQELCIFQVDALMDVFIDEQQRFTELFKEAPVDIIKLNAKSLIGNFTLSGFLGRPFSMGEQITLSRKMIRHKATAFAALAPDVRERLTTAIADNYLLERVYGVLIEAPPANAGEAVFI